jgi:lipoate-protein ligase A
MGTEAKFRSRNDLEVNGKKIAGLGVHVSATGDIQFHTSLLVDLDV